jgi:hypothetical protein
MISEITIRHQQNNGSPIFEDLELRPLKTEMASPNDWIVAEYGRPDELFRVSVAAGVMLWAHCECSEGRADRLCIHAIDVLRKARADAKICRELFRPNAPDQAAA